MAILHDTELTPDEQQKISTSLNETEIEALQSEAMLKEQAEHENQQKSISRTITVTMISILCAALAFFGIGMIIFVNIFAPQH